jgi:hypothetical protein
MLASPQHPRFEATPSGGNSVWRRISMDGSSFPMMQWLLVDARKAGHNDRHEDLVSICQTINSGRHDDDPRTLRT